MKIGFVTDTHLGLQDKTGTDKIKKTYRDILESFQEQNIETVVHLGDCIDERTDTDLDNLVEFVVGELSQFDNAFVTPGNHDAIGLDRSDLQIYDVEIPPVELYSSNNHSVLLLETAMDVKYKNVGRISDSSIELVKDRLESGYETTLITHYPLDHTETGSDVFNLIPERAFPVNKIDLREIQNEYSGNITRMFCGHLHPETTTETEQSPVLESNMVVVEPITAISLEDEKVEVSTNTSIKTEDLIFNI
jgi:DNA repair exonuclease SbcCD nuclease subunit